MLKYSEVCSLFFCLCDVLVQEIQEPVHRGEEGRVRREAGGEQALQRQKGSVSKQVWEMRLHVSLQV